MTLGREPLPGVSKSLEKQNRRAIFWIIFLFAFLLFALSAVAIYTYIAQIHRLTDESQSDLTTIYQGKIQLITNWRHERLGDAQIIGTNSMMGDAVKHLGENPGDSADVTLITDWLKTFIHAYNYNSFMLINQKGDMLLAYPQAASDRPAEILEAMQQALHDNQVALTDLYLSSDSESVFLDLLIPINDSNGLSTEPIGLFVLRIDPNDFLYPMVQTWPVPSVSGETVMFRQDGDKLTFLNALRFSPDSALKLQFPLNYQDLPAARIVNGDSSVGAGVDYRGMRVFYGGAHIPESNWYLLAKIDRDEVFADVRRQGWFLTAILALILAADLSLAFALIRRQRVMYADKLRELEEDRKEISERFSVLLDGGNDIIFLIDENGIIIDFNDRARAAYGYEAEELHGLSIEDLRTEKYRQSVKNFLKKVKVRGSMRGEFEHTRKDGIAFPVEVSLRHFIMRGKDYYLDIIRDISERKAAQKALEMSEARYRGIIEHATDGIFTADKDGRFVYANDVACQLLGYSLEEIKQKKVLELISTKSLQADPTHFWEIANGTKSYVVTEREVVRKDGSLLPVEISGFQLPEGRVQGIVRDISERIRHRQELEAALQQYQLLFQQNPIPSHIHNEKTGQMLMVNDAAVSLYGYSRDELLAMQVSQLEGDKKPHNLRMIPGKSELHYHRKKNGDLVTVEITGHRITFAESPCVLVLEKDVTERIKVENALKENLSDLQSIIDTSPLAIITTDVHGVVTLWNRAATKMFGWQPEEVIGKELAYFQNVSGEILQTTLQRIYKSKDAFFYDAIRSHKDGRSLNVRVNAMAIHDYSGEIKGIVAIISDETEHKLIEAANLAMQEERNSLLRRLQLQFKNMPVGFLLTDENLNVVDWNPAAEKIFGYSREEMIGKSEYGRIISMDQTQSVQNVIRHSIVHNQTVVSRNENLHKDGRRIIVEWHNTPLRDDSGILIAMMNMAVDVTEKVEAENKLRESEEKLRGFFESNLLGIIWASLDGKVYTANDAYLNLIGYTRQELESGAISWLKLTPKEFMQTDIDAIEKAKHDGICPPYEKQYIRKDGKPIWVMVGFVIIGENKDQSIAFVLDISERKKAEQALAESEIRYSNLFTNMLNGVAYCKMLYDKNGNEIDYINLRVNDTFEKQTGLKDIEGKRITEVIPGIREENPELFEIYGRVARTGKPESFETFVPALGIHYSIHVYSPQKGYFTVVFEDITARKLAELEIRSKQELLNLTGSIAKVGGWEFDPKTGKGSWTEEVARIHDLAPDDPRTAQVGIAFYPGENREKIEKAFNDAVNFGKPYDLELEILSAKGARKMIRTNGLPEMENGKVVRVRGIFQDITELKKAEAEIRALNEGLEQRVRDRTEDLQLANQELEAFTYSVSHDLRAPIRAIDGFSQIVVDEFAEEAPPEVVRYLNLIRKNTQNMGHLVDDLLAFSRLGKMAVNKEKVNVTRLVKGIAAEIKAQEPKRKIRFKVEKMPDCEADETLLKQVYVNLISNAVKFTREKDPAIIEAGICTARPRNIDGSSGEETSCYYVRDNGVGFDMRFSNKLFGVFQRLHSADEYEGTGVGLAIVQRVIEKHNGIIWAESQLGSGTTFYFTLSEEKNDDKSN